MTFHEVDLAEVELDDDDEEIQWPFARPDGIVLLYNVMDPPSLKGVPDLLRKRSLCLNVNDCD